MFKTLLKRRKLLAMAGSCLGIGAMTIGMAVPAGATPAPAQNTMIIGAGSNTTYGMMLGLSSLFDTAIGCNPLETSPGPAQADDYSCATSPQPGGENGYNVGVGGQFNYSQVNPYNDVVAEEPPLGSSNGINDILAQGSSGPSVNAAPVSFARSSRAAKSTDLGVEFVAYAEDAVPWFGFADVPSTVNGGVSCSSGITSLSDTELTDIYTETSATTWGQVASAAGTVGTVPSSCDSKDVDCYMAQNGSGTESTWQNDIGTGSATPSCLSFEQVGSSTDHVIFENEDSSIALEGDAGQALFYFSYGKFSTLCPSGKGACAPKSGYVGKLGEIDGVAANPCTITDTGLTFKKNKCKGTPTTFFTNRELYNAYETGSPANTDGVPVTDNQAEQATLNFVSSIGFLCNPTTYADVDPLSPTGATYGSEIQGLIKSNGFFPFPLGTEGNGLSGAVDPWTTSSSSTEAQITDSSVSNYPPSTTNPYYTADATGANSPVTTGKGYCRVTEGS
jgi:hypothetical protein